jgi:hypothetical protein
MTTRWMAVWLLLLYGVYAMLGIPIPGDVLVLELRVFIASDTDDTDMR